MKKTDREKDCAFSLIETKWNKKCLEKTLFMLDWNSEKSYKIRGSKSHSLSVRRDCDGGGIGHPARGNKSRSLYTMIKFPPPFTNFPSDQPLLPRLSLSLLSSQPTLFHSLIAFFSCPSLILNITFFFSLPPPPPPPTTTTMLCFHFHLPSLISDPACILSFQFLQLRLPIAVYIPFSSPSFSSPSPSGQSPARGLFYHAAHESRRRWRQHCQTSLLCISLRGTILYKATLCTMYRISLVNSFLPFSFVSFLVREQK